MSIQNRRRAAIELARVLASEPGRGLFRELGHKMGQPLVIVEPADTLRDVFERLSAEQVPSPARLVVAGKQLHIITLFVSADTDKLAADGNHEINTSSTIGLLLDYIQLRENGSLTFSPTWGVTASATARDVATV